MHTAVLNLQNFNDLIKIKTKNGELRIKEKLSVCKTSKLTDFASLLLGDRVKVDGLKNKFPPDTCAELFLDSVLKDWLERNTSDNEAKPRTWLGLSEAIKDATLSGALAEKIADLQ